MDEWAAFELDDTGVAGAAGNPCAHWLGPYDGGGPRRQNRVVLPTARSAQGAGAHGS